MKVIYIYIYAVKHIKWLNKFKSTDNHKEIVCSEFSKVIIQSPTLDTNICVFRGVHGHLDFLVGDTIVSDRFLYTSLYRSYAELFINDTRKCYQNGKINMQNIIASNVGTLLIIDVPKGSHYYEYFAINDMNTMRQPKSEIIFNKNTSVLVKHIDKSNSMHIIHGQIRSSTSRVFLDYYS